MCCRCSVGQARPTALHVPGWSASVLAEKVRQRSALTREAVLRGAVTGMALHLLDVCASCRAPLTSVARELGWDCVAFDLPIGGVAHDLTDRRVVAEVIERIRRGKFDLAWLAPPCGAYSCWMRCACR